MELVFVDIKQIMIDFSVFEYVGYLNLGHVSVKLAFEMIPDRQCLYSWTHV